MKFTTISIALAGAAIFVLASVMRSQSAAAEPTAESKQSEIDSANRLFQAGKFAEAGKLYANRRSKSEGYSATLQLGRIGLLSNRLDDTKEWLEKAISLRPGDADAKIMLAQAFYRRDDFQKAAAALSGVDVSGEPTNS